MGKFIAGRFFRPMIIGLCITTLSWMAPRRAQAASAAEYSLIIAIIGVAISIVASESNLPPTNNAASHVLDNALTGTTESRDAFVSGDVHHAFSAISGVVGNLNAASQFSKKINNADYTNSVTQALSATSKVRDDLLTIITTKENCGDGILEGGEACDPAMDTNTCDGCCQADCTCAPCPG